jgi:hypothetical protein
MLMWWEWFDWKWKRKTSQTDLLTYCILCWSHNRLRVKRFVKRCVKRAWHPPTIVREVLSVKRYGRVLSVKMRGKRFFSLPQ